MTLDDFITTVFCTVDDFLVDLLGGARLRQRCPRPTVPDSVVVTSELVGEFTCVNLRFIRYDTDSGIFTYFRRHHADLFPELQDVHRTTFGRQAANLWKIKEHLHGYLQGQVSGDRLVTLTDSFPVPVCQSASLPARHAAGALLPKQPLATTSWSKESLRCRPSMGCAPT